MGQIRHLPNYKYDDYKRWKGDWELIGGVPFAMSPSAGRIHQHVMMEMVYRIRQQLSNCNNCHVFTDLDWIIDDENVVKPDIMIVCAEFTTEFLETPPVLIIEIASKSSLLKDRNVKFEIYRENGVRFYLLVNPENESIEAFQLADQGYQLHPQTKPFQLDGCEITFSFEGIWTQ